MFLVSYTILHPLFQGINSSFHLIIAATQIPLATVASKTTDTGGMMSHGSHSHAGPEILCQMTALQKKPSVRTVLTGLQDVLKRRSWCVDVSSAVPLIDIYRN